MGDPIAHGYDFAWAQIGGSDIKSNGGSFVVRYLGGSARLTPQERDNLHRDGVNILLIWETAADATEGGYARGLSDARAARAEADSLGYPRDALLLFADDQNDPDPTQEVAYKRGVNDGAGDVTDLYTGGNVLVALDQAGLRTFGGWMVETWFPHDGADPFMVQLANSREPAMVGVDTATYDTDLLYRPVPMWGADGTTTQGDNVPLTNDDVDKVVTALTTPSEFGVSPVEAAVMAALDRKVAPANFVDGKPWLLLDWIKLLLTADDTKQAGQLQQAVEAALKNVPASGVNSAQLAQDIVAALGKAITASSSAPPADAPKS